jgi:hypothetical protein
MSLEIARGILDAWGREVDDLVRSLPFCADEQYHRRTVDQIERLTKAGELFARNIMAWYEEDGRRETGLSKPNVRLISGDNQQGRIKNANCGANCTYQQDPDLIS